MKNYQRLFLLCALQCFAFNGCSTIRGLFKKDKSKEAETEADNRGEKNTSEANGDLETPPNAKPVKAKAATNAELELKIAKLWARVDELEEKNKRQRERIKVLEKGLLLGLTPDELVNPEDRKMTQKAGEKSAPVALEKEAPPTEEPINKNAPSAAALDSAIAANTALPVAPARELTAEENLEYNKQLAQAQDEFQSGHYGRAIAEFSTLAKNYPEQTKDGNFKYWIALSWSNLKEFDSAQKEFSEFIKTYPTNAWIPRAEFNLAKVEISLGLREKGIERLRRVIKEHPQEDASEMAKLEISNLEKSL